MIMEDVISLGLENQRLKDQMDGMRREIQQLKSYIDTLIMESSMYMEEHRVSCKGGGHSRKQARTFKMTEKRLWRTAKNIYYRELKEDGALLEHLKGVLVSSGLADDQVKHVPLHIVKCATDQKFNALNHDIKLKYRSQAEQELVQKHAQIYKLAVSDKSASK